MTFVRIRRKAALFTIVVVLGCGGGTANDGNNTAGHGGGGNSGTSGNTSLGGNASPGGAGATGIGGQSGHAGNASSAGTAGAISAGSGGATGNAGNGGSAGTVHGGGGTTAGGAGNLEYRGCEPGGAVTRITLYRIDRTAQTCTEIVIQQGGGGCALGVTSGGFCLSRASVSSSVSACEMLMPATGAVDATAATGTFTVSTQGSLRVTIDATLQFPGGGSLPTTVQAQATSCAADCMLNDCRL